MVIIMPTRWFREQTEDRSPGDPTQNVVINGMSAKALWWS